MFYSDSPLVGCSKAYSVITDPKNRYTGRLNPPMRLKKTDTVWVRPTLSHYHFVAVVKGAHDHSSPHHRVLIILGAARCVDPNTERATVRGLSFGAARLTNEEPTVMKRTVALSLSIVLVVMLTQIPEAQAQKNNTVTFGKSAVPSGGQTASSNGTAALNNLTFTVPGSVTAKYSSTAVRGPDGTVRIILHHPKTNHQPQRQRP